MSNKRPKHNQFGEWHRWLQSNNWGLQNKIESDREQHKYIGNTKTTNLVNQKIKRWLSFTIAEQNSRDGAVGIDCCSNAKLEQSK
jgi:hypothetical protein